MADPDVFARRVAEATSGEAWVMDGNYTAVAARVVPWEHVDTLVFLDYRLPTVLWRVVSRTMQRAVTGVELWNGNRERWREIFSRDSIILWSLTTYHRRRRQYRGMIEGQDLEGLTIVHLRSPRETERWLRAVQEGVLPGTETSRSRR
jgi:hypothetical protein